MPKPFQFPKLPDGAVIFALNAEFYPQPPWDPIAGLDIKSGEQWRLYVLNGKMILQTYRKDGDHGFMRTQELQGGTFSEQMV